MVYLNVFVVVNINATKRWWTTSSYSKHKVNQRAFAAAILRLAFTVSLVKPVIDAGVSIGVGSFTWLLADQFLDSLLAPFYHPDLPLKPRSIPHLSGEKRGP